MLRFSSVSYRIGERVILDNLSFHLPKGSLCFVTGRAASGKTTLIRLASCQIRPYSGLIYTAGFPLFRYKQSPVNLRRKISIASGDTIIFRQLTILENFRLQLLLSATTEDDVRSIIEMFELKSILNRTVASLSRYEIGKIIIASSLLKKPSLLFIDDLKCFFDYNNLKTIYNEMVLLSRQGLTVVIASDQFPEFASGAIEVHLK